MKYEFHGVAEASDPDFNGTDVELRVKEGFRGDREVKLLKVDAEAMQYSELRFTHRALDRQVLIVAVPGGADDWAAYIGAVPGKSHDREVQSVAETGSKLLKETAAHFFPQFDPEKYRR